MLFVIACSYFSSLPVLFRTRLFENLRLIPHAPGVQMQGMHRYKFLQLQIPVVVRSTCVCVRKMHRYKFLQLLIPVVVRRTCVCVRKMLYARQFVFLGQSSVQLSMITSGQNNGMKYLSCQSSLYFDLQYLNVFVDAAIPDDGMGNESEDEDKEDPEKRISST